MSAGKDRPIRAIAFVTTAIAILTLQDAVVKWLSADYPLMEIVMVRSLLMVSALVPIAHFNGGLRQFRSRRPFGHLLRSVLNFGAFLAYYMALMWMPLADTLALAFSAPLFIVLFGAAVLREHIGAWRWSAVIIGFVGVLVIVRPGTGAMGWPAVVVLVSSVFYALWMIYTRISDSEDSSLSMLFHSAVLFGVASLVALPFGWVTPRLVDLPLFLGVGVTSTIGLFLLISAYRLAPASVLAPFDYTAMIWAILLGYLVWGDVPGPAMLLGTGLIVAGGLIVVHREAVHHMRSGSLRGVIETPAEGD